MKVQLNSSCCTRRNKPQKLYWNKLFKSEKLLLVRWPPSTHQIKKS